jgi:hypothetical protein
VDKAQIARNMTVGFKNFRRNEFRHRQMLQRRLQILAQGKNVAAGVA